MTRQIKIIAIGNSLGVILPKELLTRLRAGKGDVLSVIETPEGFEVRPYDADFEEQMAAAREVMSDYRDALRELAK
jgi:putative addiction module antidote